MERSPVKSGTSHKNKTVNGAQSVRLRLFFARECSHYRSKAEFWLIFRHTALHFLEIPPVFLRKYALSDEKSAQNQLFSGSVNTP